MVDVFQRIIVKGLITQNNYKREDDSLFAMFCEKVIMKGVSMLKVNLKAFRLLSKRKGLLLVRLDQGHSMYF
jgi:hypothetical protein